MKPLPPRPALHIMSLPDQVARELKKQREWRGLTQQQLAARIGTYQATIARIESGQGNPSLKLVDELFHALDRDVRLVSNPCPYAPGYATEMRPIPPKD